MRLDCQKFAPDGLHGQDNRYGPCVRPEAASNWAALLAVAPSEHHWLRPHPALRQPTDLPGRRYDQRTPAMALGVTAHRWTWAEFLSSPVPVTS